MASGRSSWNYDAPRHFNFGNPQEDDDPTADYWFDKQMEQNKATAITMPESVPIVQNSNSGVEQNGVGASPVLHSQDSKMCEDSSETEPQLQEVSSTKVAASKPPNNLAVSLEEWKTKVNKTTVPPRRSTRRPSEQLRKQLGSIRASRRSQDVNMTEPPVNKKARMRQQHMGSKGKSTEDLEMEKIAQFQKEMAEQRKLNEESLKLAISGAGQTKKKMQIPVTRPVDIKFHTDKRIKAHEGEVYKEVNFTSDLRKYQQPSMREHKGVTVSKPFKLSGSKRKHVETNSQAYVSLAEQVEAFQCRTPSRYHLRSTHCVDEGPSGVSAKVKLTKPHTPLLTTKSRARPATCKSTAEIEAEELEKIQSYKFKAQELNTKILEGGPILPKKPHVKEPTKPIGFDLEIEKRIREREENRKHEEVEDYTFHSRPCPSKILDDVVGVPEKKTLPITLPKSPAFTLKNRVRMSLKEEEKKETRVIKANPMPHYAVPFKPKSTGETVIAVQPFSFETRDKEREALKQKKIEEMRKKEAEVPVFKAQLLPDFESAHLPEKVVKPVTKVEPFHLRLDERGAIKEQEWAEMMKEELKKQKEAACFKARPNSVVYREPFLPKKADQSLTERLPSLAPEKFELATEKRAKERMEFEMRKAQKEAFREKREQEWKKEAEEHERDEIARLRQELVHKANPIRQYKKIEIKPSDQPLTVPHTPQFSERFRL
ncbi:targeting protein for Xklp2 isoform X2 [Hypanus sabinus]|uniref:targeting protein for Xklp2 isoform X2 n=1 Tax=Hypanus sabinus TaxID=79690 RepID=UPI0028C4EB79|nr:targeting protein for Xklp2 isoform X2 [Hypanus sabinus]